MILKLVVLSTSLQGNRTFQTILLKKLVLFIYAFTLVIGNYFGEEGCEQLQEILESFNMADVLGSLR